MDNTHVAVTLALCAAMMGAAVLLLRGVAAPYGRYHDERALGMRWGCLVNARLAWCVQEAPSFVFAVLALPKARNRALLAMFTAHYANRALVFPLRLRGGKPTPLGVALSAFLFTSVNGWLQATYFAVAEYPDDWLRSLPFLVGLVVFVVGAAVNVQSDAALRDLRRKRDTGVDTGYAIPRGGCFEYVSCANYFGEILEWSGFAIASGFAYPPLAFVLCTCCNLVPRALTHHQWYLTKFKDEYPTHRRASPSFSKKLCCGRGIVASSFVGILL